MSYKDLECPYCGFCQDVNHDDGFGYEENVKHQMCCENCDKEFVFTTSISYDYEPEKADCLNGAEHDWKPTITFPKEYTKMYCKMCDEHRCMTTKERKLILKKD